MTKWHKNHLGKEKSVLQCKCIFSQYTFFMYETATNQDQPTKFQCFSFYHFFAIKRFISKKNRFDKQEVNESQSIFVECYTLWGLVVDKKRSILSSIMAANHIWNHRANLSNNFWKSNILKIKLMSWHGNRRK